MIESQMVSEDRTKELANTEKLVVAEIMLQKARARGWEIVYVKWLDDAARGTPEDPDAVRSSEDAIITTSRIMLSDAESNETGGVRMAHSDTKIMPRIKPTWYGGEMKGKPNSCKRSEMEPTGIRMGVKQQNMFTT